MSYYDLRTIIFLMIMCAVLLAVTFISEKYKDSRWRLCFAVPSLVCLITTYFAGFDICMSGAYIGSLILFTGFISQRKKPRITAVISCAVCTLLTVLVCLYSGAYRLAEFVPDFKDGFNSIKAHYALTAHKQIDWDMLYDKYLPMFENAEKNGSKAENYLVWKKFCAEFHDNHVYYIPRKMNENNSAAVDEGRINDQETMEEAVKKYAGNDYGLSIMTLSDGRTVAVNVDSSLEARGIHNGTEILLWNGVTPAEAEKSSMLYGSVTYADEDNEKFYEGLLAAGIGEDTVEAVFVDENGKSFTEALEKIGDYDSRYKSTLDTVDRGVDDVGHTDWKEINDETVLLRIRLMMYDTESTVNNYLGLRRYFADSIEEYKANGFKNFIIDLRNNGGGDSKMVNAIASAFMPEGDHYYASNALWDEDNNCYAKDENGNYIKGDEVFVTGNGALEGCRIIILVNANCASAGDHLVKIMRGTDNVTVMGFTESAGVGQGVFSIEMSNGILCYSSSVLLDKDGSMYIDADTGRQSGNDVDMKIPFDENAVTSLFDKGRDYVLDYALDYLEEIN